MGALLSGFANDGYKMVLSNKQLEYFTAPKDIEGLVRRILKLLNLKPESIGDLRAEGAKISKKYDWEILVESVLEVYQESR